MELPENGPTQDWARLGALPLRGGKGKGATLPVDTVSPSFGATHLPGRVIPLCVLCPLPPHSPLAGRRSSKNMPFLKVDLGGFYDAVS